MTKGKIFKILLLLCPIFIFWGFNHENIPLQFSLILGLIAFPFVLSVGKDKGGFRYAILAGLAGISLLFFRSSSLYYFSTAFIVLFILERWWGKLNYLPLLLVIAVSPVISNIVYIWSFPIRLQLSQLAGKVLHWIKLDIAVQGNVLILDGNTFSVDPACIGLKMVVTSLVAGIILLAWFEKKHKTILPVFTAALLLSTILAAAIFANFVRLLTLILFHILPENPLHDIVGLLSMGVYVLLPFYFFVKFVFEKKSSKFKAIEKQQAESKKRILPATIVLTFLIALQIFNGRPFLQEPQENIQAIERIEIEGFKKEITPNGVLKLQNEEALIYLKPPVRFFQGSHDPRFCWQGSGYTFSEVRIENLGDRSLYTAILNKGGDLLYTAWWYENALEHTPHEWDWRWQTLKGEGGYYMINISCTEKETLKKWVIATKLSSLVF